MTKISLQRVTCVFMVSILMSACVVHHPVHRHPGKHRTKVVVKAPKTVHIVSVPKTAHRVHWQGHSYYVHKGLFYKSHKHGYIKVVPPAGLTIKVLPAGFVKVKHRGRWHFHHNGVYLRWNTGLKAYVVVGG
ncbi:DUF6515 family protein [Aliikangiella coralliicola]|uniref:Lipoprotein n=1 Tax=Aliikangiella coralliicola TaxID=2592383 RepID=A0A545UGA8_9GAMM|nr:DUF6515 family protein [Aliikangiella coralliicola]TQV88509.1 hypothetical protein FLL46_08280 [Aliikangiella coralliicola]